MTTFPSFCTKIDYLIGIQRWQAIGMFIIVFQIELSLYGAIGVEGKQDFSVEIT